MDLPTITATKRWSFTSDIASLIKAPVLIANVLPVFAGFWLALHFTNASLYEHWHTALLVITGSTLVMAGALVLNNWYEADIDAMMARTRHRPTVTGNLSLQTVLIIGITLTALGVALLLFTSLEATIYAGIGWVTYVFLYTMWSKRRYTINTVIGSVSGAVTPLIGWSVIAPGFHIVPWVLFLILFIWQMPHTYAIAMRKYEEYKAAGVAMLPVVHGFNVTKKQIAVYVACLLPTPFFLPELGLAFVVIASLLNVIWLGLTLGGLFTKDDKKYADIHFYYSVNYMFILFALMILAVAPPLI